MVLELATFKQISVFKFVIIDSPYAQGKEETGTSRVKFISSVTNVDITVRRLLSSLKALHLGVWTKMMLRCKCLHTKYLHLARWKLECPKHLQSTVTLFLWRKVEIHVTSHTRTHTQKNQNQIKQRKKPTSLVCFWFLKPKLKGKICCLNWLFLNKGEGPLDTSLTLWMVYDDTVCFLLCVLQWLKFT